MTGEGIGADGEVLAANRAFYRAFAERDVAAMRDIWARKTPVTCTHPAWPALIGRERVLKSWRGILGNPNAPTVEHRDPLVHRAGDSAIVICREIVNGSPLEATNVFVREGGRWRLAHHHASGIAPRLTAAVVEAGGPSFDHLN